MKSRPVTIEDVAAAAGVSVATVSRALRGLPNVAPGTRERVQKVARELRYRPDPSASRLATGRTNAVAMAVPVLDSWYFAQVMAGAEAVLSHAGYDLLLFSIDSDQTRRRVLSGPLVKRADGLILVDLRVPPDESDELAAFGVKVVTIGFEVDGASMVAVNDRWIGRTAVEHLLGLGHRRIALMAGLPDDPMRFAVPEHRREGYVAALAAEGVEPRDDYEVSGNFSVAGGQEAMERLLDLPEPPTAVFAMSDEMAFGAMRAVWDRGLRVPHDISVIGVDDHDFSHVIELTTIQQEVGEHGAVAARMMLEHLHDPKMLGRRHEATTKLVARRSTAPPPN